MSEKIRLKEEQLENVAGGGNCASPDHLPETHGAHIYASELAANKELYIGKKMYCVSDKNDSYYAVVTLLDVTKTAANIFEKFYVEEVHGKMTVVLREICAGYTYEFTSAYITMYAYE